jgi:cytochrome P450
VTDGGVRPDRFAAVTARLHDPSTYVAGVPYHDLAMLRCDAGVVWVDEPPLLGGPAGPGYWLVLRHADVRSVLSEPSTYSSALGGTQIRDPIDDDALRYVRRMMLNMDPPEHSRLRKLVAASFTPRAVRELEAGIAAHARAIVDAMVDGTEAGECDFAKDVAADLPLLTLADVLGVPVEDRWLMFDWSNRVIGFQDPDYASSS